MSTRVERRRTAKLELRHAYLTRYRWRALSRVIEMAEDELQRLYGCGKCLSDPVRKLLPCPKCAEARSRWRSVGRRGNPAPRDAWLAVGAARAAHNALRRGHTVSAMRAADDEVAVFERAVLGDAEARRELEKQRGGHQRGAGEANRRKREKKLKKDAQRYRRFAELLANEREEDKPERDAHADAVKKLAGEENVTPERVRRFLRKYQGTHSTLR